MLCTFCGKNWHGLCASNKESELNEVNIETCKEILSHVYHMLPSIIEEHCINKFNDAELILYCPSCKHISYLPHVRQTTLAFPGELGEFASRDDPIGILDDIGLSNWYKKWDSIEQDGK